MWAKIHTNLQNVCIQLWPAPSDCRNLVTEAGVDASRVTFDEPPSLRWESVIMQCENQRSLNKLTPVLLARYPNNPELQAAVAPWIRGNPPEASVSTKPNGSVTPAGDEKTTVEVVAVSPTTTATISETPGTSTTVVRTVKVPGTEVEVEMVPVLVPAEYAEAAQVSIVATITSLRQAVADHERIINELLAWRSAISTMSRSETAARTGGNEPGANRDDPMTPNKHNEQLSKPPPPPVA